MNIHYIHLLYTVIYAAADAFFNLGFLLMLCRILASVHLMGLIDVFGFIA